MHQLQLKTISKSKLLSFTFLFAYWMALRAGKQIRLKIEKKNWRSKKK